MGSSDIYEISAGSFDLKSAGKVLKSKSYIVMTDCKNMLSSSKAKSKEIIGDATKKSKEIIDLANRKAAEVADDAKKSKKSEEERGYAEGLDQGKQEISNIMMDFVTKSANSFSKLEADVTDVVKMALRKIIGKIDKTELITSVVKNSLQRIKMQKQAAIKVAPSEAQALRDKITELTKDTPVLEFLDICADAHLKPGSCILETELGVIDASVPVQLEAIETALSKGKA